MAMPFRGCLWFVMAAILAPNATAQGQEKVPAWDNPRRMTFRFEQQPLSTVVGKMGAGFGQKITLQGEGSRLVDFEAYRLTYFEAFEKLAKETGLSLVGRPKEDYWPGWEELGLEPLPPNSPAGLSVPLGPSRLSIRRIGVRRFLESGPPDIVLEMRWLAGRELSDMAIIGWDLDAIQDDTGATLRCRRDLDQFRGFPLQVNMPFELVLRPQGARPDRRPGPRRKTATKIRALSGTLRIAIPLVHEEAAFLVSQRGRRRRLGSSVITLEGVDGDPPTLAFAILGKPCNLLYSCSPWSLGPPVGITTDQEEYWSAGGRPSIDAITIALYDKDGREVGDGNGTETRRARERWEYRLALDRPSRRIVFRAVTKAALRVVRFAFVNIRLSEQEPLHDPENPRADDRG
jgi:hypothetical protein